MKKPTATLSGVILLSLAYMMPAHAQSGGAMSAPQELPAGSIAPKGGALITVPRAKYEPAGDGVFHGASLPDTWNEGGLKKQLAQYQSLAGKRLSVVTWFASAYENGRLTLWRQNYAPVLQRVQRAGALSLVKFSTQDAAYEANHQIAETDHIARGVYDAYFEEFADTIKAFNGPIFISIDHEMNGNWYPYSQDYAKTDATSAQFVAAWRHIVDIFRARGASNVAWVWAPNVPDVGKVPATAYYPGDSYVDWVGVSFYSGNPLSNLRQIYATYAARKPIFVTEWATAPEKSRYYQGYPGDEKWVANFFQSLETNYPRVKAISWFNWDKSGDDGNYTLNRVPAQAQVYSQDIRKARYIDTVPQVEKANAGPQRPPLQIVPEEIVLKAAPVVENPKATRPPVQDVPVEKAPVQKPASSGFKFRAAPKPK